MAQILRRSIVAMASSRLIAAPDAHRIAWRGDAMPMSIELAPAGRRPVVPIFHRQPTSAHGRQLLNLRRIPQDALGASWLPRVDVMIVDE